MTARKLFGAPIWATLAAALAAAAVALFVFVQSGDAARADDDAGRSGSHVTLDGAIAPDFPSVEGDRDGRIVGGTAVPNGKYPFMARLQITRPDGTFGCGGSLIDRNSVLTAAHCVVGARRVNLVVGRTVLSSDQGQIRSATEVFIHPRYDGRRNAAYDAAVLTLNAAVRGIEPITPATASQDGLETPGRNLTVAGWGHTSTGGSGTDRMREVSVPVVSDARARDVYSELPPSYAYFPSLMVAAGKKGKDSCQGDSGGPLFAPGGPTQVGIVSYGYKCATARYPGVYTEVNARGIRSFIIDSAGS